MSICNRDCLHCIYDDCICDEMTAEDWRQARQIDEYARPKTAREKAIAAYQREYYEANREAIAAYQREYREANKEAIAAKQREYYEANREAIAAKQREYREANKEAIAAKQREYREANKDAIAAKQREYYEANKEHERYVGAFLRFCRKSHGYSQQALGDALGVTQRAVSYWERGEVPFDADFVGRIIPELREVRA